MGRMGVVDSIRGVVVPVTSWVVVDRVVGRRRSGVDPRNELDDDR